MKIEIAPVVVVPDTSPLIHPAAVGRLDLLNAFGRGTLVPTKRSATWSDLGRGRLWSGCRFRRPSRSIAKSPRCRRFTGRMDHA
jgi:hypothetical protein